MKLLNKKGDIMNDIIDGLLEVLKPKTDEVETNEVDNDKVEEATDVVEEKTDNSENVEEKVVEETDNSENVEEKVVEEKVAEEEHVDNSKLKLSVYEKAADNGLDTKSTKALIDLVDGNMESLIDLLKAQQDIKKNSNKPKVEKNFDDSKKPKKKKILL